MSIINTQVKPFKATAYQNGKFIELTEASLIGHWSVLVGKIGLIKEYPMIGRCAAACVPSR